MIYGIGTDICDIRRIANSLDRFGERFAQRILGADELTVWLQRSQRNAQRGVAYVATRFSAKEAFSKAIGLGLTQPMSWSLCQVLNDASGQPRIVLRGALKDWFESRGLTAHISMSDEADYASSFVVVERR